MIVSAREIDPAVLEALDAIRPDLDIGKASQPNGTVIGLLALIALSDPAHTAAIWQRASRYAEAEFGHTHWARRVLLDRVARQTRAI